MEKRAVFMRSLASGILRFRYLIFLLFALACLYCGLSLNRVKINSDITAFLPPDTETRKGLSIMEEEFTAYDVVDVMLVNVTYETALAVAEELRPLPHVAEVAFDDTGGHYKNASALITVTFDGVKDPEALAAIYALSQRFDAYIVEDASETYSDRLAGEMTLVILLAIAVVVAVLLLTSRSYFEVIIFFIVFIVAALLNMGTNFWLGTVSSITHSVAVILQLALAIDYVIILSNRYEIESKNFGTAREALVVALAKAIPEIASSSLTTIAGLVALTLMRFRLGYDLGAVLAKGIFFSLITVFLLMPGLMLVFAGPIKRFSHRSFVPDTSGWGRFLVKSKVLFVVPFLLLLPPAFIAARNVPYAFSDMGVNELVYNERRAAMHKIADTFDSDTLVAVLVPAGNYAAEKAFLEKALQMPQVKTTTGLASIEVEEGRVLTDAYTPRMFAQLLNIDYEAARLLYQSYGLQHEEYQAIFNSAENYEVPLYEMFLYLFTLMDRGVVSLSESQTEQIQTLRKDLERGVGQLRGENYDRMILITGLPEEGEESSAFIGELRSLLTEYYREGEPLIIGYITSAMDLKASYMADMSKINFLTIGFVFIILIFTFRSFIGALILVFVIQGSIWINFACSYLAGDAPSFVTNMIVSAIQMGATIDYAIVLMDHYQLARQELPKKEAMIQAIRESFPTVVTSGTIMAVSGLLIAFLVTDVYVGHIGLAVGRGALISVIMVLSVLPQLILLLDKAIDKTRFSISLKGGEEE